MTTFTNTYQLNDLLEEVKKKRKIRYLFFWGHSSKNNNTITGSCLSQWFFSPFEVEGVHYPTAEHWMMAKKAQLFADQTIFAKILATKSPAEAKALGRLINNFQPEIWQQHCFEIVCHGNWHKFNQNPALKTFLLNSGDRILVEASPLDKIWGIGLTADDERATNPLLWQGTNLLGFALMAVRTAIKNQQQ